MLLLVKKNSSLIEIENKLSSQKTVKENLIVKNKMGIHARPAAMIVRLTNQFPDVSVRISNGDECVDGKSIMGIMMLAAGEGTTLDVMLEGENSSTLFEGLKNLFEKKFNEL